MSQPNTPGAPPEDVLGPLFIDGVTHVLKQVHPEVDFLPSAAAALAETCGKLLSRIVGHAAAQPLFDLEHGFVVTDKDVEAGVCALFFAELARHAVSEGKKAVTKYATMTRARNASLEHMNTSAGLQLSCPVVHRLMHRLVPSALVSEEAAVFATGVLEYLCAEVLELGGNVTRVRRAAALDTDAMQCAVRNDDELAKTLQGTAVGAPSAPVGAEGAVAVAALHHVHELAWLYEEEDALFGAFRAWSVPVGPELEEGAVAAALVGGQQVVPPVDGDDHVVQHACARLRARAGAALQTLCTGLTHGLTHVPDGPDALWAAAQSVGEEQFASDAGGPEGRPAVPPAVLPETTLAPSAPVFALEPRLAPPPQEQLVRITPSDVAVLAEAGGSYAFALAGGPRCAGAVDDVGSLSSLSYFADVLRGAFHDVDLEKEEVRLGLPPGCLAAALARADELDESVLYEWEKTERVTQDTRLRALDGEIKAAVAAGQPRTAAWPTDGVDFVSRLPAALRERMSVLLTDAEALLTAKNARDLYDYHIRGADEYAIYNEEEDAGVVAASAALARAVAALTSPSSLDDQPEAVRDASPSCALLPERVRDGLAPVRSACARLLDGASPAYEGAGSGGGGGGGARPQITEFLHLCRYRVATAYAASGEPTLQLRAAAYVDGLARAARVRPE